MTQYTNEEFEDSLRRAFELEAANYGVDQGWLVGRMDTRDEQSSAWVCRLTDKGREYFGV